MANQPLKCAALVACALVAIGAATPHAKPAAPRPAPRPLELYSVAFASPSIGWVGGNGAIFVTGDGGRHWQRQYTGRVNIYALAFADAVTGWAAGMDPIWGNGVLLGTTDGGSHWKKLSEPPHPLRSMSFADASNGIGIAGGSLARLSLGEWGTQPFIGGRIVLTHDGGRSWSILDTPQAADSACMTDATHLWMGNQASVQRSIDSGAAWHYALGAAVDPYRNWSARVACADRRTIWALFETTDMIAAGQGRPFVLYRSGDGGASWSAVLYNANAANAYHNISAQAASTLDAGPFAVNGGASAFVLGFSADNMTKANGVSASATGDAGATWHAAGTVGALGATSPIGIAAVSSQRAWVVGTVNGRGRLFATADGGRTWTEQTPQ